MTDERDEDLQDEEEEAVAKEEALEEAAMTAEEVQTQAHETYAAWWAELKKFAAKHRETPTTTPKTVGEMVLEFIEKTEAGQPCEM